MTSPELSSGRPWLESSLEKLAAAKSLEDIEAIRDDQLSTLGTGARDSSARAEFLNRVNLRLVTDFQGGSPQQAIDFGISTSAAAVRDVLDREAGSAELIRSVLDLVRVLERGGLAPDVVEHVQDFFSDSLDVISSHSLDVAEVSMHALGVAALSFAQHPPQGEDRRHWAELAVDHFAHAEEYVRRAPDGSRLARSDSLWRAIANRCVAESFRADSELELCQALRRWAGLFKGMARQPSTWRKYRDLLAPGFFDVFATTAERVGVEPGHLPGYRLQLWRLAGGPWFDAIAQHDTEVPAPDGWADSLLAQERSGLVAAIAPADSNSMLNREQLEVELGQRMTFYFGALLVNVGYPRGLLPYIFEGLDSGAVEDLLETFGGLMGIATGHPADLKAESRVAVLRMRLMIGDEEVPGEYRSAALSYLDHASAAYGADVAVDAFVSAQCGLIRSAADTAAAVNAANDAIGVARAHRDRKDYAAILQRVTEAVESRSTTGKQAEWSATVSILRAALIENDGATPAAAEGAVQSGPDDASHSRAPDDRASSAAIRLSLASGDLESAVQHALVGWRQSDPDARERGRHAGFLLRMHEVGVVRGLGDGEYLRLVRDAFNSIEDRHLALPGMAEILVILLGSPRLKTGMTQAETDDLAYRTRQAYAASPHRSEIPAELRALITAPSQRSIADALGIVNAALDPEADARVLRRAVGTLFRLMNSGDAASAGFNEIYRMSRQLYDVHAGSRTPSVTRDLTYLVGESARRSGKLDVARHYLSQIMEASDLGAPSEGYEADHAQLAMVEAIGQRDFAQSLFWLERIRELTDAGSLGDDMLVNLGGAVFRFASEFGLDEVRALAVDVEERLRELADRSTGAERAKAEIIRTHIALLEKDAARGVETIARLSSVLDERLARPLEAGVRRQRVHAAFIADATSTLREDFERLTFLQDQELLHHAAGGLYEDLLGDEPLLIALWAIRAGDVELAIDALERGNMRYLFLLQAEGAGVLLPNNDAAAQRLPASEWREYFVPLTAQGVLDRAMNRPIVYAFATGGMLTLLGLSKGKANAVTVGSNGSDRQQWEPHITRFWRDLALEWVPADIVPVVINNGVTPEEVLSIDRSYIDAQIGTPALGRPTHLPSARFAVADTAPEVVEAPAIFHIGDDSGTLIGPWLEAAWLSTRYPGPVTSLVGQSADAPAASTAGTVGATLIASCHGSFVDDGSHFQLGIGEDGLSLSELFSTNWLSGFENVVFAACDSGANAKGSWRRDALSAANAALVAGAKCVIAPTAPVNDLVSAFFVCGLSMKLSTHNFAKAMDLTLEELVALTPGEFLEDVHILWDTLWESNYIDRMPWSPKHAEAAFWRMAAEAVATEQWRILPLIVLDGRRFSAADHEPQVI